MLRDRLIYALTACIMLAACGPIVPATVPAQLAHTPGAPIVLSETRVEAETFSSAYPDGWRIVKASEAGAAAQLVFVSPDERLTIILAAEPLAVPEPPAGVRSQAATVELSDEVRVMVIGQAADADWAELEPVLERVLGSVSAR